MNLEVLQARLALYLAAEVKILQGQEYVIENAGDSRRLRRAALAVVRAEINNLTTQIAVASAAGRRRVYRLVPG